MRLYRGVVQFNPREDFGLSPLVKTLSPATLPITNRCARLWRSRYAKPVCGWPEKFGEP